MFKQNFANYIHVVPVSDLTGVDRAETFYCPARDSDWSQVVTGRRESYQRPKVGQEVGADQALVAKVPSWRDESCRGWAVITRGPCRVEKLDYGSVERWSVVWCSPRTIHLERNSSGAPDYDLQIIGQCILLKSTRVTDYCGHVRHADWGLKSVQSVAAPSVEKYVTDQNILQEFYRLIPRAWVPPEVHGKNPRFCIDSLCRLYQFCGAVIDGVDPAPYSDMWDKSWPKSAKAATCAECGK